MKKMKNNKNIIKFRKDAGQSIAEYAIMCVVIASVMIVAINGPIRNSLQFTFDGLIEAIRDGVEGLIQ